MAQVTLDQIAELLAQSKAKRITSEAFQRFIENPMVVFGPADDLGAVLARWQELYQAEFGLKIELSEEMVPTRPEGKWRLIVAAKGVTIQQVYDACKAKFPAWKYTESSLDEVVVTNDRDPNKDGTYAIWVRDVVEADKEFKNLSANQFAKKGIKAVTLMERLLHELVYFMETGGHLDLENWTLCAGSRHSDGYVPHVDWYGVGKLSVGWSYTDDAHDDLRAREAVSINP